MKQGLDGQRLGFDSIGGHDNHTVGVLRSNETNMCWKDAPKLIRLCWLPPYIPCIICKCESMHASSLLPCNFFFLLPPLPIPAAFVSTLTVHKRACSCVQSFPYMDLRKGRVSMLLHIKTTHSKIPGAVEIKFREEKD